MAKLIRINPNESRDTLHDVEGIGTSMRRKHPAQANSLSQTPREYYAVRLVKAAPGEDQTEYYVEMSRYEAIALLDDLNRYVGDYSNE